MQEKAMDDIRKLYDGPIDFAALAQHDAGFAKLYATNKNRVDFTNPGAVKQLTISLLKKDFGLSLDLPDDRLCPPVPNRLNYILWLQDLIDSTSENLSEKYEPNRVVTGLDIGTGSSCVYPLLGCATRPKWRFIASDIDEKNLEYARRNIQQNGLEDRVKLYASAVDSPLLPLDKLGIDSIDFVMTNPPFYSSKEAMIESAQAKSRPPFSSCTGSEVEMIVPGGEVAFVTRIIEESLKLRERVQWFSAMLGRLESVKEVLEFLFTHGLNDVGKDKSGTANWAVKEFVQGLKTRRWAIAWSWIARRPANHVARGTNALGKQLLPFPTFFTFDIQSPEDSAMIGDRTNALMSYLDLRWKYKPQLLTGVAMADKNVWSRSARREKQRQMDVDMADEDEDSQEEPALTVKVVIKEANAKIKSVSVEVRWLIGRDAVLFESFCGMLKRELSKK